MPNGGISPLIRHSVETEMNRNLLISSLALRNVARDLRDNKVGQTIESRKMVAALLDQYSAEIDAEVMSAEAANDN